MRKRRVRTMRYIETHQGVDARLGGGAGHALCVSLVDEEEVSEEDKEYGET
jgi:hypothetical protein